MFNAAQFGLDVGRSGDIAIGEVSEVEQSRAGGRCKQQGQTTLVVDKYVERLLGLADRHIVVERGRIAWTGSSAEFHADRGIWSRYLGV